MPVPLTPFDQPSVAVANLLKGSPYEAITALLPGGGDRLTPQHRQTLGEEVVGPEGEGGFTRMLVETFTNPLFLAGLVMSMAYPALRGKQMLKFRKNVVNAQRDLGPLMKGVAPFDVRYANTGLPEAVRELGMDKSRFMEKYATWSLQLQDRFRRARGVDADGKVMAKVAAWLDGLDAADSNTTRSLQLGRPLVREGALWESMDGAERNLAVGYRELLTGMWEEAFGSKTARTMLQEALVKQGGGKLPRRVGDATKVLRSRGYDIPDGAETFADLAETVAKAEGISWASPKAKKAMLDHLAAVGIGDVPTDAPSAGFIRRYFPHLVQHSQQDMEEYLATLLNSSVHGEGSYARITAATSLNQVSKHALKRYGMLAPDPEELKLLGDLVDPEALRLLTNKLAERKKHLLSYVQHASGRMDLEKRIDDALRASGVRAAGTREGLVRELTGVFQSQGSGDMLEALDNVLTSHDYAKKYTLNLGDTIQRYTSSLANQHAWTTLGHGHRIHQLSNQLDTTRRARFRDLFLPSIMGKKSYREVVHDLSWAETQAQWLDRLGKNGDLGRHLPDNVRSFLTRRLTRISSKELGQGLSGKIAGYFYLTTLGLSPSAAIKNLLQTALTTYPTLGGKYTLIGMDEAQQRMRKYWALSRQKASHVAFREAFPELVEAGLDPSPVLEQLREATEGPWLAAKGGTAGLSGKAATTWEKFQEKMMWLFTSSEQFNRATAFYGGRAKALAEGMDVQDALMTARQVVQRTQFPAGPTQTPTVLMKRNPLVRQFLHFPLRYMEFLWSSTKAPHSRRGPYLGSLGRGLMASTAIYQAGKNLLGMDLSPGLMTGALPLPMSPNQPFYPFPIVPPAVSLAGAAGMAAMEGSLEPLEYSTSLLVPGGVAGAKAFRALSPTRADYENRTPDGRIPLYTGEGKLLGYQTPLQLIGRAMGLGSLDQVRERELMQYLISQREEIREVRKEYIHALTQGDIEKANEIKRQYEQMFPQAGQLEVRQKDLDAAMLQKRITRLESVLDTLPPDLRPLYGQMVGTALGNEAESLLGVDPGLLAAPNMTRRRRPRSYPQPPSPAVSVPPQPEAPQREGGTRDVFSPFAF